MQNKICSFTFIAVIVLMVSGCITPIIPKIEKEIENKRTFNETFEKVWNAAVEASVSTGEVVKAAQKENGLISTQKDMNAFMTKRIALIPSYITPGNTQVTVNFNIIKVDDNHTTVIINSRIWAWTMHYWDMYGIQQELGSNGVLEKEYLDKIKETLEK